jgi:hypothetical protein
MTTGQQFFEGVRAAAEGTPYTVTKTDDGFDVALDIVDAQWYGVFNKAGLKRLFIHHVDFKGEGVFSITDESRALEWVAGTPRISASAAVTKGRIIGFSKQKVWAFDEHGNFGVQADYRFSSDEGRGLIEGVARQLGLEQRRGTEEKIGMFFAALAIGGLVIGGIVVGILALLGTF